ncbi:alpha/beta hydrolase family protein [Humibacter albus]|uniref:alpha/beta hydrolase family protein n=1 Tax=Humibacter albus TaxID=427754 RepID=UPI0003B4C305|nr:prolyl oligopeptidase family serine peptidase [Humibacter albus]
MSAATHTFSKGFSSNEGFDFDIRAVLGAAASGASDPGEVLAAVDGIAPKNDRAWFEAWTRLGDRVAGIGSGCLERGHAASGAAAWLRASTYYGVAVNAASALDSADELAHVFHQHREAWDRFVDATPLAETSRVSIPYENTSLPGYLFRPRGASGALPLLIGTNGSDGSLSSMWATCAFGALQRGYAVLLYDGPGQQTMLFDAGTTFRPDWEAVLTPVLDFALALDDTDPKRIAAYGISQAGYWVTRALGFEHRFAAAIVDPGVVDVSTSWSDHLPKSMLELLDKGENDKFDRDMAFGLKLQKDAARTWAFRARPYGPRGYAETLHEVRRYRIDEDVAAQITTPLLITWPEREQFWPGQSEKLAALTPSVSTLVPFTAAEGADFHCEPLARALVDQRMFDWLDERLA